MLTTGLTLLGYVNAAHLTDKIVQPADLDDAYVAHHPTAMAWLVASLVGVSCLLAIVAAGIKRRWSGKGSGRVRYVPHQPLWVSTLGSKAESIVTVDLRDGRRVTGYLEGYEVDGDSTPSLYLSPPLLVETVGKTRIGRPVNRADRFSGNAITISGSEVLAVWTAYTTD